MNEQHTPGTIYKAGTRYTNSNMYDEATNQFVCGWQVFMQKNARGEATGRQSFINNRGILCGIELAQTERDNAMHEAAPYLVKALRRVTEQLQHGADEAYDEAADAIRMAVGHTS